MKPTPVGSFPANAWGLHDMHGNLLQWCQDRYGELSGNDETDPQGPEKGLYRVLRGGSWRNDPGGCRSATRSSFSPGFGLGLNICGFRLCVSED